MNATSFRRSSVNSVKYKLIKRIILCNYVSSIFTIEDTKFQLDNKFKIFGLSVKDNLSEKKIICLMSHAYF